MPDRRLPVPDTVSQPFWDSCQREAVHLQQCGDCKQWIFYPRNLCPHCFGVNLDWKPISGQGTIYSFIICHTPGPGFTRDDCPYVSAIIELEEGCRLHSNLVDAEPAPDAIRIGAPVEIVYEKCSEEITLPLFRLV